MINHLKLAGDISVANVRKIIQDTKGFIWVGTQDGLIRYESNGVTNYNTTFRTEHKLVGADIKDIVLDSVDKKIWIASAFGGINGIDIITGNVTDKIDNNKKYFGGDVKITALQVFKHSIYIGTTSGLFVYDKLTHSLKKYSFQNISAELNDVSIQKIIMSDNFLLIFAEKGVYPIDIRSGISTDYLAFTEMGFEGNIQYPKVYDYASCERNTWFFATNFGIRKISINKNGKLLFVRNAFNFLFPFSENETYSLCFDKNNKLWISNSSNVIEVNFKTKGYSIVRENSSLDEYGWLPSTYHLFCDQRGIIWLGCQQGLAFTAELPAAFESFFKSNNTSAKIKHCYYLAPVNDSIIFACAANGLYKVNFKDKIIYEIDETKSYDYVFVDHNGKIIISNDDGLFILMNDKLISIDKIYPEFKTMGKIRINSCVQFNDSCFALGTENLRGVFIWNYKIKKLENWNSISSTQPLKEDVVNNLFLFGKNKFAILGDSYFSVLDFEKKSLKTIDFGNGGEEYNIFFDLVKMRSEYYLAAYGKGILILDSNLVVEKIISMKTGLSNNGVYKLLPWKDSLLFITTNNGLNVWNVKDQAFKYYFKSNGLHGDAFEETSGNTYHDILFAGGANGFTAIYPANISPNKEPPLVYFCKVSIEFANSQKNDTSNILADYYSISNDAIQTNIYFSGINYSNPERTIFAYRITEQSKNWINLSTQNFITLIGLSPGTYHLQVKAANEDGIWSEPKELVLEFLPKWYQTWWFKFMVLLITAGIIYAFYRYRISQIKKQHEIRKNIATDLHDDLGSTLNSVKVFTNLAISGVKQEESLQQVKDNLNEATMGLRDMIWVLDDSLDTVDELVTRLKQYAIPVAQASNIETIIKAESDINNRQLSKEEKRNLFLVSKEAINNSIKYAQASQINIAITSSGKKIQIIIADNGIGFNASEVKKGYGLKNMQYRAGQIKYKVNLISEPGKGTKISIQPL